MGRHTDGIVHSLVDCWLDPAVLAAGDYDFSDFPGCEVAEAQFDKFSFLV